MDWGKIIGGIISGVAGSLLTALVLWGIGAIGKIPTILVPGSSVIAFDLAKCPDGWSNFEQIAGRVIVGVGEGVGLAKRNLLETGGAETHILTVAEMPAHTHTGFVGTGGASFEHHQFNTRLPGTEWERQTGSTGGSQAHNNMQPFVALRYCKKI